MRLEPARLIRVHPSVIVNVGRVREAFPVSNETTVHRQTIINHPIGWPPDASSWQSSCSESRQMSTSRSRKRDRYLGSAFWGIVSLLFGWTLYVYWWWVVLHDDQPDPLARMLVAIAVLAAVVLVMTYGWIGHNQRLARRGGRGKASRLRTAVFDRDALGRPIVITDLGAIRAASVVVVHSDAATKRFAPGHRDHAKAIDHPRGTGTRG